MYNGCMRHIITNIDSESKIGDCSVCGPQVRLKPYYGKQAGQFRCYLKYMENKHGKGRFKDGTKFSAEETVVLQKKQNGKCAICQRVKPLVIDHCHAEKKVRGLLCHGCNTGLGLFEDNVESLRAAIAYLSE